MKSDISNPEKADLPLFEKMIGSSSVMKKLFALILTIAKSDGTVLIQGESGTGKEMVARAVHSRSKRKNKEFLVVNCAAIPEALMEGSIFGYNRGAFTGAIQNYCGKLETANEGTVFMDDIDTLDLKMQSKLLRTIQEKEFERLGSHKVVRLNVRFVAASNKNLRKMVSAGNFREDLFYRLNVLPIYVPPLRQRKEDIADLIKYFVRINEGLNGSSETVFSKEAVLSLMEHDWPGNVRELRNVVERLLVMHHKPIIRRKDLSILNFYKDPISGLTLREARQQFEKQYISRILESVNGNRGKAAKQLGIHRNTLLLKTNELKLDI